MSTLSIQTRDGSTPKNKLKIYVCCHPDDREELFPTVANDLWRICDAALCYDPEPQTDGDNEVFFSDLREMRLAVVIVTRRFLTQESRDRDVILPHLVARSLPILPLVRESGLDELFASVMGDLQYLDVTSRDDTALPYVERLKHVLNELIPDGDTIERIRAAFSAYIFLSYRRIDRKEARELMYLIHENDVCRDVAIWYDDFLTPGEDFNTEIAEAITKSQLFTMAVTPNIVKDNNYIIQKEYPFALGQHKSILPVELYPTDRASLSDAFDQIPNCVSHDNKSELAAALGEALAPYVQGDGNPMRDYLIGLAHLNGIDVERDPARALFRIRTAAKKGLYAAHEKLVEMYWNGDGVPIDREQSCSYQEKLVNLLKKQYEQSGRDTEALAYARALYRLAKLLCEMHRYKAALPYAKKARSIIDGLSLKDKSYDSMLPKYATLCGEIHLQLHQDARGILYLLEALVYVKYDIEEPTETRRQLLAVIYPFYENHEKKIDSETVETIVWIAEAVYDESGSESDKEQLVRYLLLAIRKTRDKALEQKLSQRAVELLAPTENAQLSEKMKGYTAEAYIAYALTSDVTGEKIEYAKKALALALEFPHSINHRSITAAASYALGHLLRQDGRQEEAEKVLADTFSILREIAQETNNVDDYRILFEIEALQDEERCNDALKYQSYQIQRWKELSDAHPNERPFKKKYTEEKGKLRLLKLLGFFGVPMKNKQNDTQH